MITPPEMVNIEESTLEEKISRANLIFIGKVKHINPLPKTRYLTGAIYLPRQSVTFRADRVLKGAPQKQFAEVRYVVDRCIFCDGYPLSGKIFVSGRSLIVLAVKRLDVFEPNKELNISKRTEFIVINEVATFVYSDQLQKRIQSVLDSGKHEN